MVTLLSNQLLKLLPNEEFNSPFASNWIQEGAINGTYRRVVATLATEIIMCGESGEGQLLCGSLSEPLEAPATRNFYFRVITMLMKGSAHANKKDSEKSLIQFPFIVSDVFGYDNVGELLDVFVGEDNALVSMSDTLDVRHELVRFVAAEASALRLAHRRMMAITVPATSTSVAPTDEVGSGDGAEPSKPSTSQLSTSTAVHDNTTLFSHEDARFALCLLLELPPTTTSVAALEKASRALIANISSSTNRSALVPVFGGAASASAAAGSVTAEHRQAIEAIRKVLVNDYTLRWATQLERMQCTLRAFMDLEGELVDHEGASSRGGGVKRANKGISPSCAAMSAQQFAEMGALVQHASGTLNRLFDAPLITIDGDLFPIGSGAVVGRATMCVGMVKAAFAPISLFRRKTNFSKRNTPLVPVPDRGGRTNVSNFERAVSSSSRQKDSMMRGGDRGGRGGGGGGGGRGGGGGGRHSDPNGKPTEKVGRSGNRSGGGGK